MSILPLLRKNYSDNDKYIEVNAQALNTLKHSAFAVWNTLTSLEIQMTNNVEKEYSGDESDQSYFIVQGNDSFEINSDTQVDDSG